MTTKCTAQIYYKIVPSVARRLILHFIRAQNRAEDVLRSMLDICVIVYLLKNNKVNSMKLKVAEISIGNFL